MQTQIAFVLPICMVMYSRNFVKPHLSCYTLGYQTANLNNPQTVSLQSCPNAMQQVFHGPSVCQLRLVIDNLASVISGAGGNTYIRQMNICGQINLLITLQTHTKYCGLF